MIELVVFDMYMHVLINFPSYTSYKNTCTFLKSNICGSCIKFFKRSLSLEKISNPFVYDVLLYVFIIFICKKLFVLKWNVKWCNSMRWRQYDIRQLSFFALNMSHFIENLTGDMLQWRQGRKPPRVGPTGTQVLSQRFRGVGWNQCKQKQLLDGNIVLKNKDFIF